jgi:hypothetical protein
MGQITLKDFLSKWPLKKQGPIAPIRPPGRGLKPRRLIRSSRPTEIFQASATAIRVLQCACPVAASRKYFSAIHTSPHITSTHLTPDFVNNIILHLVSVPYTAVNVWNKKLCLLCLMNCFHYLA